MIYSLNYEYINITYIMNPLIKQGNQYYWLGPWNIYVDVSTNIIPHYTRDYSQVCFINLRDKSYYINIVADDTYDSDDDEYRRIGRDKPYSEAEYKRLYTKRIGDKYYMIS